MKEGPALSSMNWYQAECGSDWNIAGSQAAAAVGTAIEVDASALKGSARQVCLASWLGLLLGGS
jgi:hypothetical protein